MSDSAKARQARQDATAAAMYRDELKNPDLDPAVRAIIEEEVTIGRGLSRRRVQRPKMDDSYEVLSNRGERDASELPEACNQVDFRETVDEEETLLMEKFDVSRGRARLILEWHREELRQHGDKEVAIKLARASTFIFREANKEQACMALLFATRTASANGFTSMRKACVEVPKEIPTMAKGHIGVASLSKVSNRMCSFLGLPPGEGMKDNASVKIYSETQKKIHKKRRNARRKKALQRFGDD